MDGILAKLHAAGSGGVKEGVRAVLVSLMEEIEDQLALTSDPGERRAFVKVRNWSERAMVLCGGGR